MCPSPLHVALCTGKFTNAAEVAPQNCNFAGCGAYTGEAAVDQMALTLTLTPNPNSNPNPNPDPDPDFDPNPDP